MRLCVVVIGLVAGAVGLAGGIALPLPKLVGTSQSPVPLALLAPVAVAFAISYALSSGNKELELVAGRRIRLLDAAYAACGTALTVGACGLVSTTLPPGNPALAAGRDAMGYVGLALIGRRLVGPQAGALLPSSYLILSSLVRPTSTLWSGTWGWALATSDNTLSWWVVVTLLLVGIVIGVSPRSSAS